MRRPTPTSMWPTTSRNAWMTVLVRSSDGIASSDSLPEAFEIAYNVDPLAAFGCVIGLNRTVDLKTAEMIAAHFVDCVIAPGYEPAAQELMQKKKNIRLIKTNGPIALDAKPEYKMKRVKGGMLVQTNDHIKV